MHTNSLICQTDTQLQLAAPTNNYVIAISERHVSIAYFRHAKLEDAAVTQIRKASYQPVDLSPEALLTDLNW